MSRLLSFVCAAIMFMASGLHAQVSTTGLANAQSMGKSVYGLGASISLVTGIGVSFRTHLPSKSSVQGVLGIIKTSSTLYLSLGGEYQFDLVRSNKTRFYVAGGVGFYYKAAGPFRTGVGVGGEFQLHETFHASVGGMYVFYSDGRVLPLPQVSAHYYFN